MQQQCRMQVVAQQKMSLCLQDSEEYVADFVAYSMVCNYHATNLQGFLRDSTFIAKALQNMVILSKGQRPCTAAGRGL